MATITVLYSTFATKQSATKALNALLKAKLVACGVVSAPASSQYFWKGAVAQEKEVVLLAKTTTKLAQKASRALEKVHSYQTPCILHWKVQANSAYARWVAKETA